MPLPLTQTSFQALPSRQLHLPAHRVRHAPAHHTHDSPCRCQAAWSEQACEQQVEFTSSAPAPPAQLSHQHLSKAASLSRVLLIGQSSTVLRNFAQRRLLRVSGPVSLLVFLFSLLLTAVAAIRNALIRRVKECRSCHGFGVVRCRLCNGDGVVSWRAKFSYSDVCPLCASRRLVRCPDCGGHHQRVLFRHVPFRAAQAAAAPVADGPKLSADWS